MSERLAQVADHLSLPPVVTFAGDSVGKRLVGKVAIITGCNSIIGIGRATAHQYAHNGPKALYICDFVSDNLAALQSELQQLNPGVDVHARQFDASDEEAVKNVVDDALGKYGRLDVFHANAGILAAGAMVWDIGYSQFEHVLKVNVLSVFLAIKYASKAMQKTSAEKPASGGSIIATASSAGLRSGAGPNDEADYSASKAAVISMMQTSAFQLAGTNIRCNSICPGLIETGMTATVWEGARKRGTVNKIGQINPLRRGGVADEVARVALFLASDESSYVNAQFWSVDGGLSGSHPTVPGRIH